MNNEEERKRKCAAYDARKKVEQMICGDFHTHTSFSTDSTARQEDMIEKAIASGLTKYCITDHMDYMYPHGEEDAFIFNPKTYWEKLTYLKAEYSNKIELLIGIELGLRDEPECRKKVKAYYEQLTSEYPFDFVLGSTHVLFNYDPYYKEFWDSRTTKEGLFAYFKAIEHNVSYYSMFQVYGHLDYIIRYIPDTCKDYNVSDYSDIIELALKALIQKGIGIECNTSGFRYGLNRPHPRFEILKRYHELGGEIITVGSDAHTPEFVANEFTTAEGILREAGFRYYTTFKNQKPQFHKL